MSRIIVKNLPKNTNEDKLRSIFGTKGQITDVQLKYTKDGQFRRFGFIGYQNETDAAEAIKYFNNSRINTTKISVQECATLGDENKPKSWSKYATDSSAYQKIHQVERETDKPKKKVFKHKDEESKGLLNKYKDDPLFDEFLEVHSAKKAQEILKSTQENEDSDSGKSESAEDNESEEEEIEEKVANKNISDEDYLNSLKSKTPRKKMEKKPKVKVELHTLKLTNLPYSCKKKDIKDFLKPIVAFSIRIPRGIKGIAFIGFKDDKKCEKALQKNKSIINGKQIVVCKYVKKGTENDSNVQTSKWANQEERLKNEEGIAESGRIFLRNLAYSTKEDDIQELFEKFGPIAELNLPVDPTTRSMKGFGVVTFVMPEHAVKAYSVLDGKILHGRMLHLLPGKPKDGDQGDETEDSTSYKQKKAKKQKSEACSSHNWNSLFLGQDAVANVIADTYNTSKEAVLGPHSSGSAAVRLALGETQIISETRKYLENHGVFLDAFNTANVKRSKTIILVKNLPANTEPAEIKEKFNQHGVIGRFIFPPNGITAIVEFVEPSEARKAFSKLAYTKFKNLPLYLEWAPENSLAERGLKEETVKQLDDTNGDKNVVQPAEKQKEIHELSESKLNVNDVGVDDEPEPDTTIFVKNLDFRTTDKELYEHFKHCGKISYANVATKKDPTDVTKTLSMGYGFVRFVHKLSTDDAMKTLQHSNLSGKSLELKRSERTLPGEVKSNKKSLRVAKQTGTKILIRNIPFQANRDEVLELFKTFGEIKALRLPKKMTPGADSHRGFAFVDFGTNSDAKKAFDALSQSTHLYGRRLVLEWAQKEENVAEIRKRTADHFHEKEVVKSKKSVFDIEEK